ncbi:MAG: hypothetical protein ACFFEV_00950 [Candidatus Thorarchaeota archaeon]
MRIPTNSNKCLQFGVILALMLSLLLPLSSTINPAASTQSSYSPMEFASPAAAPMLNLTYHTLSDSIERPVASDIVIAGDHVILTAVWNVTPLEGSRLEVIAPAIPANLRQELESNTTVIDTRYLGNNATCIINATAWLPNGTYFIRTFENVYIGNFFVPKVTVTSPNGNETWTGINNITWSASDLNADDELLYDILLSSDNGTSFEILTSSLSTKWFEWDCSALDKLDTYIVEIRVTDGIYFSSDRSDSSFTAGEIAGTTITTTTTTTTTSTTFDSRLTAFVVILLVSCSLIAIVVYYAARKWF